MQTPIEPKQRARRKNVNSAGFFGTFIMLFADLLKDQPTLIRVGNVILRNLDLSENVILARFLLFIVILLTGYLVCWVHEPKTRLDAFTRGMSVFALLAISPSGNPNIRESQTPEPKKVDTQTSINVSHQDRNLSSLASFFSIKGFSEPLNWQDLNTNATIIYNEWVSSCKPGPPFYAIITNSIEICKIKNKSGMDFHFENGQRVKVIKYFDTRVRDYRYIQIEFRINGELRRGWIYSGREPYYYFNIRLDSGVRIPKDR